MRALAPAVALSLVVSAGCREPAAARDGGTPLYPVAAGPLGGGPIPEGLRGVDAAECGRCHRTELRAWMGSAHALAFTDALFQAEHRHSREPWCARCHAPRAVDPDLDAVAAAGVDCAACHVARGAVLAPSVSGRAPHRSLVEPRLASSAACADCHQFDRLGQAGVPMQDTVAELRQAGVATQCQGCHDPHRAPVRLEDALDVTARAWPERGGTRVQLDLRSRAGHAVPTGDVFRRLEVAAEVEGSSVRGRSRWLGRRFSVRGDRWVDVRSDAVPATGTGERRVSLFLPTRGPAVAWSIRRWRMPLARIEQEGLDVDAMHDLMTRGRVRVQRAEGAAQTR